MRRRALGLEVALQDQEAVLVRPPLALQRQGPAEIDVEVAGMPEGLAQAFQLGLEPRHPPVLDHAAEQREGRAQAAQGHPQLVQGLDVAAREQHGLVEPGLAQAGEGHGLERLGGRHLRVERHRLGLHGAAEAALDQGVAALELAQRAEAQGHVGAERPGEVEQGRGRAAGQLELDLADRGDPVVRRPDPAAVEGDLDAAAARSRIGERRTLRVTVEV